MRYLIFAVSRIYTNIDCDYISKLHNLEVYRKTGRLNCCFNVSGISLIPTF